MDIKDFNLSDGRLGSLGSISEQMAGLGAIKGIHEQLGDLSAISQAAFSAAGANAITEITGQRVIDGFLSGTWETTAEMASRVLGQSAGSVALGRATEAITEACRPALLSATQSAADALAEQAAARSAAFERSLPQPPDLEAIRAAKARLNAMRPARNLIPPPVFEPRPMPPLTQRQIESNTYVRDLEDRLETVEAERDELAARCAALERKFKALRMLRRGEFLDASQEHTPEPPVNDSQFPDPK